MSQQDDIWDYAYAQAVLMWLNNHGYTPHTIPAINRRTVAELAREHAMFMADLALETWLTSKAPESHRGGSVAHLLFDRDSTQVLDTLQGQTQLSLGEVIRNSVVTYEWLRQQLIKEPEVTITREMVPNLFRPLKPRLSLV